MLLKDIFWNFYCQGAWCIFYVTLCLVECSPALIGIRTRWPLITPLKKNSTVSDHRLHWKTDETTSPQRARPNHLDPRDWLAIGRARSLLHSDVKSFLGLHGFRKRETNCPSLYTVCMFQNNSQIWIWHLVMPGSADRPNQVRGSRVIQACTACTVSFSVSCRSMLNTCTCI